MKKKWLVPPWGAGGENSLKHNTNIGRNELN